MEPIDLRRDRVRAMDFRQIAPFVRYGTASDRYAGWIGQIYPAHYADRVAKRSRKLGGQKFEERTVPIESAADYFEHFDVLELDFTFYRPLLEPDGQAGSNWYVLEKYAQHAPPSARFLLKAPQLFTARRVRRKGGFEVNETFLDAAGFVDRFLAPAADLLGPRLLGVLFEQEYQRKSESPHPASNISELDAFFSKIPGSIQIHLELRSSHFLVPDYFEWLQSRGLGFVFSHWSWLPSIREQWKLCGERFSAADRNAVARLLTPLRMAYADAYALAHPFDRPVPALCESRQATDMILDATALAFQGAYQNYTINTITNNRAWGNAPLLTQALAERLLEEEARRASL